MTQPEPNNNITCVSCQHEFTGTFCPNCGEKVLNRKELTVSYFLTQIIGELAFWDTKFFKTVKLLILKPGFLVREFNHGRRNLYTKPVQLFFIANLIYFFFQPVDTFNTQFVYQVSGQKYSAMALNQAKQKATERSITLEELNDIYNPKSSAYSKLFLVIMVLFFAVAVHLFNMKKGLFYENMIYAFNFMALILLGLFFIVAYIFKAVFLGVEYFVEIPLSVNVNAWWFSLILVLYLASTLYQMQRTIYNDRHWVSILKGIGLTLSFIVCVLVYRFFLFEVTLNSI